MRTTMKYVVVLVGLLGMATIKAAENSPNAQTQGAPVIAQATVVPPGATTSTLQSEHATKMRTLGVCEPASSLEYTGDNTLSPIVSAHGYFHSYEHRDVTGAATVTILQQPKHGILRLMTEADGNTFGEGTFDPADACCVYLPEKGYGKDSATLLVDFGGGLKVKVVYFFLQHEGPLGNTGLEDVCGKRATDWQISAAPPEEIPPPIVTDDAASLVGRHISERVISPVFLGRYNNYTSPNPLIVSPDGLHVAYVAGFGAKTEAENVGEGDDGWKQHYLIVDGKKGKKYDDVTDFHFSPDSKHTVYRVEESMRCTGRCRMASASPVEESNDGNAGTRSFFVVDGREGVHYVINDGPIRYLSDPKFSPDSSHFAYQISASAAVGPDYVVVDGKKGNAYANISRYSFSPDGQRLAYIVNTGASLQRDVREFSVVDGQEGKRYERVSAPTPDAAPLFSPDSKRVAYVATNSAGGKIEEFAVVDGVEHHAGTNIGGISDIRFSPDSLHFLYQSGSNDARKQSVVVDDSVIGQYDAWAIFHPIFSPNSKRTAYVVETQVKNGEVFVVVDGQEGKHYSGKYLTVNGLTFSPDSKRVAYYVQDGEVSFVVVDGIEYAGGASLVTFSPDGLRLAYVAYTKKDKKWRVVVNGQEGKQYDAVDNLVFSPDGKTLAYAAYTETYTEKSKKWRVVVNGKEGKAYDLVLCVGNVDTSSLHFDGPDKFHYLAVSGKNIVLVEENLGVSETK